VRVVNPPICVVVSTPICVVVRAANWFELIQEACVDVNAAISSVLNDDICWVLIAAMSAEVVLPGIKMAVM
jgi:hypothetical protein